MGIETVRYLCKMPSLKLESSVRPSTNMISSNAFFTSVKIFENCYIYNPDTHDVVAMARKLEEVSPPLT